MTALSLLHHGLLGVSIAALAAAGVRAASVLTPRGLERVVVAATFAVSAAVAEALVLGLFELGGDTAALTLAACATWFATRLVLPRPAVSAIDEVTRWWYARSTPARAAIGAIVGAGGAWAAWQIRHPELGLDFVFYHLPEMVLWIQHGTPATIEHVLPTVPVGNYPVTAEVTMTWAMAIGRSLVLPVLFPWGALALIGIAGYAGLGVIGLRPVPRVLAIAAFATNPWLLAWQQQGTITDPAALAWMVVCWALCALSRTRAVLLAPAIVAAGLSVGCKTTTLPYVAVALALGIAGSRSELRRLVRPLALCAGTAVIVGGVWYLRNTVQHGSPFWPFVRGPWGDPLPHDIDAVPTFFGRLGPTVDRLGDRYLDRLAGALLLLASALLIPLISPRRRTMAVSLLAVSGFVLWGISPVTGVGTRAQFLAGISSTRYLLPVVAVCALGLALAASERGVRGAIAIVLLGAATVLNLVQTFDLGFPHAPPLRAPLLGAAAGAAVAVVSTAWRPRSTSMAAPALTAVVVVVASLLTIPASGLLTRHAVTSVGISAGVTRWLSFNPAYQARHDGVTTSVLFFGPLAGDTLEHRLSRLPPRASCRLIRARSRSSWLIVSQIARTAVTAPRTSRCLGGAAPAYQEPLYAIFPVRG